MSSILSDIHFHDERVAYAYVEESPKTATRPRPEFCPI
jgi:hypothetical protein